MGSAFLTMAPFICVFAGFMNCSLWGIPVFVVATLIIFYLSKPGALSFGLRELGLSYLLLMVAGNTVLTAAPFFLGVLASWALQPLPGQAS